MPAKKKDTFEEAVEKLEKIVNSLEKGELSLDESLKLFEEGIQSIRFCTAELTKAQGKLEILFSADQEGIKTETFKNESEAAG